MRNCTHLKFDGIFICSYNFKSIFIANYIPYALIYVIICTCHDPRQSLLEQGNLES